MSLAAAPCPNCPSDAAAWEPVKDPDGYLIGDLFACKVCSYTWIQWRAQAPGTCQDRNASVTRASAAVATWSGRSSSRTTSLDSATTSTVPS